MGSTFISVIVAFVFGCVFLAAFPSVNTLLRSITPTGVIPIVGAQVALMPYLYCGIAFFVLILIVKNKVNQ